MSRRIGIVTALVLLAATTGVVLFGVAARTQGQQALADVLARHAAAGYGTTAADLAAMAPVVDRDRQARLHTWMRTTNGASAGYRVRRDPAWWRRDGATPPADALEAHAAFRPAIEELEALFTEGGVCLTSLGWMPEDLERATVADLLGSPIPNLLRLRSTWNWYSIRTALADEPGDALAMLRRLHDSVGSAGCLIDPMITVACDAIRDDAMLLLVAAGRCPTAALEAWLAEPPRAARLVADGLRGERLRFAAPLAQALVDGGTVSESLGDLGEPGGVEDLWAQQIRPWLEAAGDCAAHLEAMVALERHVRGEIGREEVERRLAACEDVGYPFSIMMPDADGTYAIAASSAARHRMIRAAAALARDHATENGLPGTQEEALAWLDRHCPGLLAPQGEAAFRYRRLDADRFRLTMDAEDEDAPAAVEPLVLRHGLVEIEVR